MSTGVRLFGGTLANRIRWVVGRYLTKLGQRAMWPQACNQIASSCAHQYKPFTYLFNPIGASNWIISLLATEDPLDLSVKKWEKKIRSLVSFMKVKKQTVIASYVSIHFVSPPFLATVIANGCERSHKSTSKGRSNRNHLYFMMPRSLVLSGNYHCSVYLFYMYFR